jgi:hypothetical protein
MVGSLVPSSDHAGAVRSMQHSSSSADGDGAATDSQGHRGHKHRCRSRRHRNPTANVPDHQASISEEERDEPRPDTQVVVPLQGIESGSVPPICVVNFTEGFTREELELRCRGLFVSVISTRSVILANEVVTEVARSFQLDGSLLKIHHSMSEDFLLLLPDEETTEWVFDGGKPLHGPWFSLQFKKWTRFVHVTEISLPSLVDIEIRGIPAHAWERSTAEQLLRDSCWIVELHQETLDKQDLSSFQLRVWCSAPNYIPHRMELVIPEPEMPMDGNTPVKRTLSYPIEITAILAASPSMVEALPPPPADGSHRHDR